MSGRSRIWRDGEGYFDPTAGAALSNIRREERKKERQEKRRKRNEQLRDAGQRHSGTGRYNCLTRQYEKMMLGTVEDTVGASMISARQLPSGIISGSKLALGSVGIGQLQEGAVGELQIQEAAIGNAHIQNAAISAANIQSAAIEFAHIAAATINSLNAGAIEATTAKIASLRAADIQTDSLAAALAAFTVITCGTATFDAATIKHLVAQSMNLDYGAAGQVFIRNLAVEYAQMIGASIGNLCIKASDGNYYSIDVDSTGNVTGTLTTVTEEEIDAASTSAWTGQASFDTLSDGQVILYWLPYAATSLSVTLNLTLPGGGTTGPIDVYIDAGTRCSAHISAGNMVQMVYRENVPLTLFSVSGWWITRTRNDNTYDRVRLGYMYSTYQMYFYPEHPMYRLVDDVLTAVSQMAYEAQVAASTAQATADAARADFRRVVRIDNDGLHVGDNQSTGEVLIDSESVNVVMNGSKYSRFAGNYVQFGNYQLRRTTDGGLAFKMTDI